MLLIQLNLQAAAGLTPVSSDLAGTYTTLQSVSSDSAGNYAALSPVSQDAAGSYAVLASVSSDLAGSYQTLANVSADAPGSYGVLQPVSGDSGGAATVLQSVSSDLAGSYTVLQSVQSDAGGAYSVLSRVSSDTAGTYEVQSAIVAPAGGGHGFEMYGGKRVVRIPLRQRVLQVVADPVKPKTVKARRAAKVIEVKAAKVVLADGGEQKIKALMRQWVALAPIPQQADPYELFLASVALRIRQIEQDDEDVIFMMMA